MAEQESSEVFLTKSERLFIMKSSLREVIKVASNEERDQKSKKMLIDRSLEDFFIHLEAAGAELNLNVRERTVLGTIAQRGDSNTELIAQRCAQFLGALNHDARYPISWEAQPTAVKGAFLSELDEILDKLLSGKGDLADLCYLEELISGFLCHEDYNFDPGIQKLCFGIEECIRGAFRPNGRVDFIGLQIRRGVTKVLQDKFKVALS